MTAPIGLVSVDEVIARHGEILDRIASRGVAPESIEIVAVTKSFPSELIAVAVAAGFRQLGENYPQELAAKAASIELAAKVAGSKESTVQWHAIGQLQRNKVKLIAPYVALWQTIDRQSLVATVAQHAPGASVLVQINVTADDRRGGCRLSEVDELVEVCRSAQLDVRGLMTVGPVDAEAGGASEFRAVRAAADRLGLSICSMGMSDDLEIAVSEGATMIRIGSALFGERHY